MNSRLTLRSNDTASATEAAGGFHLIVALRSSWPDTILVAHDSLTVPAEAFDRWPWMITARKNQRPSIIALRRHLRPPEIEARCGNPMRARRANPYAGRSAWLARNPS